MIRSSKLIQVCDKCLTAACWYGEFMCDDARTAGTVAARVGDLRKLNREHPDYWSAKKLTEIYGESAPDFSHLHVMGERKAA
jgi:hypothetical protein